MATRCPRPADGAARATVTTARPSSTGTAASTTCAVGAPSSCAEPSPHPRAGWAAPSTGGTFDSVHVAPPRRRLRYGREDQRKTDRGRRRWLATVEAGAAVGAAAGRADRRGARGGVRL